MHLLDSTLSKMQSDVKPGRSTAGGHCFGTTLILPPHGSQFYSEVELSFEIELVKFPSPAAELRDRSTEARGPLAW